MEHAANLHKKMFLFLMPLCGLMFTGCESTSSSEVTRQKPSASNTVSSEVFVLEAEDDGVQRIEISGYLEGYYDGEESYS